MSRIPISISPKLLRTCAVACALTLIPACATDMVGAPAADAGVDSSGEGDAHGRTPLDAADTPDTHAAAPDTGATAADGHPPDSNPADANTADANTVDTTAADTTAADTNTTDTNITDAAPDAMPDPCTTAADCLTPTAPCRVATCEAGQCAVSLAPTATPCDDDNACTTADSCTAEGFCTGLPRGCDDDNPCTSDGCDVASGCVHNAHTLPCSDGDACTSGDTCAGGGCQPGDTVLCNDGNPCTDDTCDKLKGCLVSANTAPCTDNNACTQQDTCVAGTCAPGLAATCDDSNPCTLDGCHVTKGCWHQPNSSPCDDGDACTTSDHCAKGKCQPGAPRSCADDKPCTDDGCTKDGGCVHLANAVTCTDGNGCTVGDTCKDSACQPGAPLSCDDSNPCTDDACQPTLGCVHNANQASCNDGDVCTHADRCAAGSCAGKAVQCDDNNPCTVDTCAQGKGCKALPAMDGTSCGAGTCFSGGCHQPPSLNKLTISPLFARKNSVLTCKPLGISAGVTVTVGWQINGKLSAHQGDTLGGGGGNNKSKAAAPSLQKGDVVRCVATLSDAWFKGPHAIQEVSPPVTIANTPPQLAEVHVAPQTPLRTTTLSCLATGASDADGDVVALSYTWFVNGKQITPATSAASLAGGFTQQDWVTCRATPTDGDAAGVARFAPPVRVGGVPVMQLPGPAVVAEGETLSLKLKATDADGDPLTYEAASLPKGATLDGATGVLTFLPSLNFITGTTKPKVIQIPVRAHDGITASAWVMATIVVENTNQAPNPIAPTTFTLSEPDMAMFLLKSSDPDGDGLLIEAKPVVGAALPPGVVLDGKAHALQVTTTYDTVQHPATTKTIALLVRANDGKLTSPWTQVKIVVKDTNRAPVITALPDQYVPINRVLKFTMKATDPDGDAVTWLAMKPASGQTLPSKATFQTTSGAFQYITTTAEGDTKRGFVFRATDGVQASAPRSVTVIVHSRTGTPPFSFRELPSSPVTAKAGQTIEKMFELKNHDKSRFAVLELRSSNYTPVTWLPGSVASFPDGKMHTVQPLQAIVVRIAVAIPPGTAPGLWRLNLAAILRNYGGVKGCSASVCVSVGVGYNTRITVVK